MLNIDALNRRNDGFLEFETLIDVSFIKIWGEHPFPNAVTVKGTLEKTNDGYNLNYNLNYTGDTPCIRCLTRVEQGFNYDFSHVLKENKQENVEDDFICVANNRVNLTDIVVPDIIFHFQEETHLCKEDCKGLCFVCGINLNEKSCQCETTLEKEVDPRFDALRELLGKQRD